MDSNPGRESEDLKTYICRPPSLVWTVNGWKRFTVLLLTFHQCAIHYKSLMTHSTDYWDSNVQRR